MLFEAVHEYLLVAAGIVVMALMAYSYAEAKAPRRLFGKPVSHMEVRQLRRVK